jgi:hypothetical protein
MASRTVNEQESIVHNWDAYKGSLVSESRCLDTLKRWRLKRGKNGMSGYMCWLLVTLIAT